MAFIPVLLESESYALRTVKAPKSSALQGGFNWDEAAHPRAEKGAEQSKGGQFVHKEGIELPTKSNEQASPGDQLGLFGDAAKPKSEGPATIGLKPGEATKGKAQNLFDTHGDKDQMDLFGDGVMPDELVNKDVKAPALGLPPTAKKDEQATGPIPFRDRKAFAAKLASEGKLHSEIIDAMVARGVAIVDARRLSSGALGDIAQGVAEKPTLPAANPPSIETNPPSKPVEPPKLDVPETPAEKASSIFDAAIDKGDTPRQAAEAAQKKLDEDYEFARASEVRNAGEDLKGSARHKVNQWKSLAEAEENGTAGELVTRDKLLKNEPADLMIHADRNPLTALAMHYAMKAFPAQPGTSAKGDHKKDREQYLEAYRSIKDKAEELARTRDNSEADQAVAKLWFHVKGLIDKFRGAAAVPEHLRGGRSTISQSMMSDRYNQTANDLVSLHKALASGYNKTKTGVTARMNEFSKALRERYGADWSKKGAEAFGGAGQAEAVMSNIAEHAKDIMEGKSINVTFGRESKKNNRFDPSEAYVKIAKRVGGRDLAKATSDPNKAVFHMVNEMGLRGVQWGNTVSDEERKHHAAKAVEALTDLADVTGLHPKDIALGGKLGLAIGARGKGNASAHYEPGTQVINLTRASGVGALAHEWGHAFDHMLNEYGTSSASGSFMSGDFMHPYKIHGPDGQALYNATGNETGLRPGFTLKDRPKAEVRKAYSKWWDASEKYRRRLTGYLREQVRDGAMSAKKASDYWSSNHEIFARSFERHVMHKLESDGKENTYLAGLGGAHPLWPTKEEAAQMADSFDGILSAYRKDKHGSPDVVKFSRREALQAFRPVLLERY